MTATRDRGFRFCLAALAAWRITHLLSAEDGPGGLVAQARGRLGPGLLGDLADCFGCLSLWVSAPLAPFVVRRRSEVVVCWLALSGAACLLERLGGPPERVVRLSPDPRVSDPRVPDRSMPEAR